MTISYNWLSEYLPEKIAPDRLSVILTSIGLEVEKMEAFEEVKGGLKGLVIGEVLEAVPHPNADKLRLTRVNVGTGDPLQIVCGAPNVAAGQKVVVAPVGTTIYPVKGEPLTMKLVRIRGSESQGMICAEDEIGVGDSHAGIMVLPPDLQPGTEAATWFKPYSDIIYEIGLTPNRMDAMSHWGVARDVCAYLSHHDKKPVQPVLPHNELVVQNNSLPVTVVIENEAACKRYSGISIANIAVQASPRWLQERLKAIGQRPINNIVDITNFIQHETGQPLHAFDYDAIKGRKIIVKNLRDQASFITLDEKERKLSAEDLVICNAEEGMCIAGVFGGLKSGVTEKTKNIFLESAFFDPATIRKTSFRHGLRTDAAMRFEKGIDISSTVQVLKRAARLIQEIAGGTAASEIIDVYPHPEKKARVTLTYDYLKKLSGKTYPPATVKNILEQLRFEVMQDNAASLTVAVPFHKRDVSLPADIVEEVLRIDGLDNIEIPGSITITPSVEENYKETALREKTAQFLAGAGFSEILTNSITNSRYSNEADAHKQVRMINNLSTELDVLRPSMLPTALEVIAFNLNRKNGNLRFFEFGKTYQELETGRYNEEEHLCLYLTGNLQRNSWKGKAVVADLFYLKGMAEALFQLLALKAPQFTGSDNEISAPRLTGSYGNRTVVELGQVAGKTAQVFGLKQAVFFADFRWDILSAMAAKQKISFREIPRFPAVERDLAIVVSKETRYDEIRSQLGRLRLDKLQEMQLFDVFESEKLGPGRKSLAINFTFLDEEKTLTDKEIDSWMGRIMATLEKELNAEIRK